MTNNHTTPTDDPLEIFLVEDNPGDIRLIKEAFGASDHETVFHAARNGDEAVNRLCEQATHEPQALPDIALVDLNLPGRDGCEVLKAIRDHSQLNLLPVIMLTSSSDRKDIERCYSANANAFMTKPTSADDLESLTAHIGKFWSKHAVLPPTPA